MSCERLRDYYCYVISLHILVSSHQWFDGYMTDLWLLHLAFCLNIFRRKHTSIWRTQIIYGVPHSTSHCTSIILLQRWLDSQEWFLAIMCVLLLVYVMTVRIHQPMSELAHDMWLANRAGQCIATSIPTNRSMHSYEQTYEANHKAQA